MAIRTDIYKSALRDYDAVKSTSEAVKNDMKKRLYDENTELGLIDKKRETFNNFRLDYYSKTMKAENGLSYYDNMRLVYMSCMKFAECFESEHSNILLMGKTGLGKTFLCNSIARYVLERGYTVIYISAGRLFKTLQKCLRFMMT